MASYMLGVALKVGLAVLLGGIVGWQREVRDRPAGLRTHILVCLGSLTYTLSSLAFSGPYSDPGRIAAQVATGMGFLGAGTIIRHGTTVRGLTTAASLWAVAAVGIAIGIGGAVYWVALLSTLAVLVTLTLLRTAEARLLDRSRQVQLTCLLQGGIGILPEMQKVLASCGASIGALRLLGTEADGREEWEVSLRIPAGASGEEVAARLGIVPGLRSLRWE